jgi:uncharacterized CHY-type Zn-finger protein
MSKSPGMIKAIDKLSQAMFGNSTTDCLNKHICVICGNSAIEFRNELSATEYQISAMCQDCQDQVFGL